MLDIWLPGSLVDGRLLNPCCPLVLGQCLTAAAAPAGSRQSPREQTPMLRRQRLLCRRSRQPATRALPKLQIARSWGPCHSCELCHSMLSLAGSSLQACCVASSSVKLYLTVLHRSWPGGNAFPVCRHVGLQVSFLVLVLVTACRWLYSPSSDLLQYTLQYTQYGSGTAAALLLMVVLIGKPQMRAKTS